MAGQKKLDRRYAEHLAGILRPIVRDQFEDNQTAFAKRVGVSQSQVSAILKVGGGDRSVGINVLIRIRAFLGTMTLDEMLGLPPLAHRDVPTDAERIAEVALEILDRRASRGPAISPRALPAAPSPPRRRRPT